MCIAKRLINSASGNVSIGFFSAETIILYRKSEASVPGTLDNECLRISMEIVNNAAGIDIGSRSHWVAFGQWEQDVRKFGVSNQEVFAMADWMMEKNQDRRYGK